MLSSSNIGLELPSKVDNCANWKTAPKGRRRAVRRARTSFAIESNLQKTATTSSNGSENASDEEFKEADQSLASESEKFGVTVLRRRFSETIQNVPIKKRMRLLTGFPAPSSPSFPEASSHDNHIDFSGISILADAACNGDSPDEDNNTNNSPKGENGENGSVMPLESSSCHVETTTEEALNDGSEEEEKSSKAEKEKNSRETRLHWDLNTTMETWEDCDEQEGGGDFADFEQNTSILPCKIEVCNEPKEEEEEPEEKKDGNEDQEIITVTNDGNVLKVATPKESFELLHRDGNVLEGDAVTEVASKKDSITELGSNPQFDPSSSAKEEVKRDNEPYSNSNQLSVSEHDQVKEEIIKGAGPTTGEPIQVNLDLTTIGAEPEPEPISEECINESSGAISAPDSEPKDAMMGNNGAEHDDSMIGFHKKLELGAALQKSNSDQPAGIIIGNNLEKVDKKDDYSDLDPPIMKNQEEDDYQYEDGELREPATQYWETERGPRESDERGDYLIKESPVPDDAPPVMGSLSFDDAPPQGGEDTLSVAEPGAQPDCIITDINKVAEMDMMKSEDQIEWMENNSQANDGGGENNGDALEFVPSSRMMKATGWDKLPECSRRNSESPLKQEEARPGPSVLRRDLPLRIIDDKPISSDDPPHRNDDNSYVRPRRSKENDLDARAERNPRAPRLRGRGGAPLRHHDTGRREEHWVETRICTGRPTRQRTPEFAAPSYAPSNSGDATAASIAKVASNGFMVAPDGTLVKAGGGGPHSQSSTRKCQNSNPSFYRGSPSEREHRGFRSSRERVIIGGRNCRYGLDPAAREQYHHNRPVIEISPPGPSRRQRSFSPQRAHIHHHISPPHIGSPSRSRTRSPNTWISPPVRGRHLSDHEPRHRVAAPDYDLVHRDHHNFSPHGIRCVNESRRCTSPVNDFRRRSPPPRNARFHPLDPLHRPRDEMYHQPVHSGRCNNGFDHRQRGFDQDQYGFERNVNRDGGFRPRNNSEKGSVSHRRGFYRGLVGDVNHRGKEDRDNFQRRNSNNAKFDEREMRDRSSGDNDDDANVRRRLS